jgi:hypothetical protein
MHKEQNIFALIFHQRAENGANGIGIGLTIDTGWLLGI